jgi:DNA-directed RNA polymerase subunit RPC12/RpoP
MKMATLRERLDLDRCPHCSVDRPDLIKQFQLESADYQGNGRKFWRLYRCSRCGNLVLAYSQAGPDAQVSGCFPETQEVEASIPERAREYLLQALNSLHAPAGAVMLGASAVDAMLKAKGYKDGNLYNRIEQAAKENLITADMAKWAHEVRLDANEQRHADELVVLPGAEEARRTVDFALALGQFLFVLPARVQRGLADAAEKQ